MANPELKVIVITGDGDCAAIGGNHLIHAARRNIGITTIAFNNSIYGMTSGQYSPLTPTGCLATTAPHGNVDRPFDLCELVRAAGASYVARGTAYHARQLTSLIAMGLTNDGFSFIEAVDQCPTYFGRKNKRGGAWEMLKEQQTLTIPAKAAAERDPAELLGKLVTGVLHHRPAPEYTAEYQKIIDRLKGVDPA